MKFICADSKVSFTSWQWHGNGQEIRAGEFVALVFISVSNCSSDAPHTDWLQQAAKRRPQFLLKQRVCIFLHSVHCSWGCSTRRTPPAGHWFQAEIWLWWGLVHNLCWQATAIQKETAKKNPNTGKITKSQLHAACRTELPSLRTSKEGATQQHSGCLLDTCLARRQGKKRHHLEKESRDHIQKVPVRFISLWLWMLWGLCPFSSETSISTEPALKECVWHSVIHKTAIDFCGQSTTKCQRMFLNVGYFVPWQSKWVPWLQGTHLFRWNQTLPCYPSRDQARPRLQQLVLVDSLVVQRHRAFLAARVTGAKDWASEGQVMESWETSAWGRMEVLQQVLSIMWIKQYFWRAGKECGKGYEEKGVCIFMSTAPSTFFELFIMMFIGKIIYYLRGVGMVIKHMAEATAAVW